MIFWSGTRQELIWRKTMVTTAVRLEPPNISGRWSMSHYQGLQLNIEYLTWYLWLCICFCNGVVRLCIVYLWLCIWYFCLSCIWNFTYDADHRYAQCPFSSICWKSIWEARSLYRKVGWIDDHKEVFFVVEIFPCSPSFLLRLFNINQIILSMTWVLMITMM